MTFYLTKQSNIKELYYFICTELSFDKVMQLYRLLESDICYRQEFKELKDSDKE